jgi:hypothetical protein
MIKVLMKVISRTLTLGVIFTLGVVDEDSTSKVGIVCSCIGTGGISS